jgi:hypothetical protein
MLLLPLLLGLLCARMSERALKMKNLLPSNFRPLLECVMMDTSEMSRNN